MEVKAQRRQGVTLIEMMVVVTIIAIMTGIAFPALSSGLAGIRLASAAGTVASFLTASVNRVERHEIPASVVIFPKENRISRFTVSDKADDTLEMPSGVFLEGDAPRRIVLMPGGTVPRVTITLRNEKGARRSVTIDPVTGVPSVRRLEETAREEGSR